jgi:drug/metabolite transporter (DMT)-like permease
MPHWSLLALGTACCTTAGDLALRALLRQGFTVRLGLGLSCCLTALLALPLLLVWPSPLDGRALLVALLASGLVNALAFWAYGRGVARGDFSLALPLLNLSPLVLLGSGWLLLGERPGPIAAAGVVVLVFGALLLRSGAGPGRQLWHVPGAPEMLLTAVLWGIGASIDKLGVRSGGGLLWVAALHAVVGLPLLLPALLAGDQRRLRGALPAPASPWWRRRVPLLLAVALLALVGTSLQMEALQSTDVVHVVAIKRLSTLLGSLAGVVWLGEPGGALRLPAAGLMFSGALIVLLAAHA